MNKSWLISKPIAHRGLHNKLYPENSIGAFENAINKGYPIELDVQISSDGELFVFHDYNLKRMCNIDKDIIGCDFADLNLNLKGTKYKISTLKEVLELVNGRVPLLIEVKNPNKVGLLEDKLLSLLSDYDGEFAIQSFNLRSLVYLRTKDKEVVLGIILGRKFRYLKIKLAGVLIKASFIAVDIRRLDDPKLNKLCKNRFLLGWTVKGKSSYNLKLDNIIFEEQL